MTAGPCAVETEEQCLAIAEQLKPSGVRLFRGGAYKPRTSPYSFQGLGLPGLKILAQVRKHYEHSALSRRSPSTTAVDLST